MAYVLKSINDWTLGIMELRGIDSNTLRSFFNMTFAGYNITDRRALEVPLTSPASLVLMIAGYLYFIRAGTRMMQNRKPFQLRGLIMIYNIVQVVLNFWLLSDV